MESNILKRFYTNPRCEYQSADQIAIALAISKSVKQSSTEASCDVCLNDPCVRGQMLVDWSNRSKSALNVEIVTSLDVQVYENLLTKALS